MTLAGAGFAQEPVSIEQAWSDLLPGAVTPQAAAAAPANRDFLNHFFFESRTDYWRYTTSFTGLPTVTGVIDAPFTGVFNPNGIPYPDAFQPAANRIEAFLDWGTRGYLDDRVNTHFAFRYAQDITAVTAAAPAQGPLETFAGNRELQLLQGSVEIRARPDGRWTGTSLELGRQYVYGAELAALDGGQLSWKRAAFDVTIFGGRRFSYFSEPGQRAMGGANLVWRPNPDSALELSTLWYIRGTNRIAYERRFRRRWQLAGYLRSYGGAPVDFSAQTIYAAAGGGTTLRLAFFEKLTDRDYSYDYSEAARQLSASAQYLYLGPRARYSQFTIDARRAVTARLEAGGTIWIRRLNEAKDQGPFDTSFADYRVHAQYFPGSRFDVALEYHRRNSDRLSPVSATTFGDVQAAGETSVQDFTGDIRRSFRENRLSLHGGVYYRRISMQDQFYVLHGLHQSGWLASGWLRVDQRTRLFIDYCLDNSFFLFRPDIANSRALRVGLDWKY